MTNHILFFDTGEAGEEWFKNKLPEWTPGFIENWLTKNTNMKVIPLGVDTDRNEINGENYSRTLFACIKE